MQFIKPGGIGKHNISGWVCRERSFVNESKESWTNYSYYGFFKVKPNTDLEKLEEKLSKWDDDHERIENRKMDGRIVEIISKLI